MSYAFTVPVASPDPFHEPRRKFTADEVYRMLDAGILEEGPGLELLEGDLVVMSPQGAPHAGFAELLRERLLQALGPGHNARTHAPVDAGPHSQPEPDVAVVRGRPEDYLTRHPTAADTLLVVEVARSSLPRDRRKARIYAQARFAEYWLFDVEQRSVLVHRDPDGVSSYGQVLALGAADRLPVPGTQAELDLGALFALLPA
ncbi:MAG: Uma2 family endonuclease [Myxococcales bacterium]|nr:Uma2 family endonuclease [Myxococcales bacterium]